MAKTTAISIGACHLQEPSAGVFFLFIGFGIIKKLKLSQMSICRHGDRKMSCKILKVTHPAYCPNAPLNTE
jgi:hypothetical protein